MFRDWNRNTKATKRLTSEGWSDEADKKNNLENRTNREKKENVNSRKMIDFACKLIFFRLKMWCTRHTNKQSHVRLIEWHVLVVDVLGCFFSLGAVFCLAKIWVWGKSVYSTWSGRLLTNLKWKKSNTQIFLCGSTKGYLAVLRFFYTLCI